MRAAARALSSCRRLSQFAESGSISSWHRTPIPLRSSVFPQLSSIGAVREHVGGAEKPQPLWMPSTAAATSLAQRAVRAAPLWASNPSVSGLESALWTEAAAACNPRPRLRLQVFAQGYATSTPSPSSSAPSSPSGRPSEKPEPKKTGILKQMLLDFGSVPVPALALGIAGLIPFVALAPPLASLLPLPEILQVAHTDAQAAYGACILSFLGAVHWGLAMADYAAPGKGHGIASATLTTARYVWSVVPSLMAWAALLLPPAPKFALLILSFGTVLGVDFLFARLRLVPFWFLSLRWPLTAVAVLSMTPSLLVAAATNQ